MRRALILSMLATTALLAVSQTTTLKPAYDFSMSREQKIKLAESAAPPEVSGKAAVFVLEPSGYVKVREGTNGFSCIVDRQSLYNLEPTCFDAEGTATTLLTRMFVEEQRAKGKSEAQIKSDLDAGYQSGKFKAPSKPGIVYMMSDDGVLLVGDNKLVHIPPHLMFYAPYDKDEDIGSPPAAANMPRLIRPGQPDAYIIVMPAPAPARRRLDLTASYICYDVRHEGAKWDIHLKGPTRGSRRTASQAQDSAGHQGKVS